MSMTTKTILPIINLLSELVVFDSYDFNAFLQRLINLILRIVPVDSCLIYIYDQDRNKIILVASKKQHRDLTGNLHMKEGEGITGWVVEHKESVILKRKAYTDPRFKVFTQLKEDTYEAFLSVPIVDKKGVLGVINLQNRKVYEFRKTEVRTVEAIVKIIASAFEKVVLERKVTKLETELSDRKIIEKAKGKIMEVQNISEAEAYALIRREAMKKRKTKKEIAEAILLVWG